MLEMYARMLTSLLRRWALPVAAVWVLITVLIALQLWPDLPRSRQQWLLLIGLGPPLYIALEAWGSWVLAPARGWAVSRKRFSLLRLVLLLPLVLFWSVAAWWLASLVGGAT